jgi:hypothetical protein
MAQRQILKICIGVIYRNSLEGAIGWERISDDYERTMLTLRLRRISEW